MRNAVYYKMLKQRFSKILISYFINALFVLNLLKVSMDTVL